MTRSAQILLAVRLRPWCWTLALCFFCASVLYLTGVLQ